LGRPVVAHWCAVIGLPHTPDVTDLVAVLESAGVRERSINPGLSTATVEAVQALAPQAVQAAPDDIHVRRREIEDELTDRLEANRTRVQTWRQEALWVLDQQAASASAKKRRDTIGRDADELTDLIDNLATSGQPFVRVIGVLVPQ